MEGGRWSSEALQAMETHLGLLKKATTNSQCETAAPPWQLPGLCETDTGPLLDLNSNVPLPLGWEQFLDLQTGQVYYVDWKNYRRSYMDPRTFVSEENEDLDDSDVSECVSDADNGCASSSHVTMRAHTNKLLTIPFLQEDWDLMETRGWTAMDCDDALSELTCEMKPTTLPNNVNSSKALSSLLWMPPK